ncbi:MULTISPECIES: fimbrial protein [Photorhabdus]|uniref:fimbrial protein n=1 Tax=Photorhabdus TaxID=29487 RepID=UPI000DCBE88C|nr:MULTISPECIES: fimbrial protein [Photorhabdus]MCT8342046.1 type 1 fimbrial protein [Photorhabdus kleinii]RAW94076.1 fimbrial protein [Photorhabdus sp. S9-53]RAW94231.1 fimbrial protein [Photorhabdus sp. S10-54]RAW97897.1 fimbrial protein [Photorhabdus sp. S8-52]
MKKNFILASLVTVSAVFSSFSALSYDGTIKFRGTILANGCTISSGSKGIQEVNFGKIPKERFKNATGTIVASQLFKIDLTNCPGSDIDIQFFGTPNSDDRNLYSSNVSGVGIQLTKDDNTTKINANEKVSGYKITGGNTSIPLIAKLQSTHATIGHGTINSDVNFTLIYP